MPTPRPHGPVTIAELTAGLIWPKLLRAFGLSVQPGRLVIGIAGALVIWGVLKLVDPLFGGTIEQFFSTANSSGHVYENFSPLGGYFLYLTNLYIDNAIMGIARHWYFALPVFAVLLSLLALFSGAIARSAAADAAADLSMSIKETARFALVRWKALVFSVLIPIILITLLCAIMAPLVWLIVNWQTAPVIQILLSIPTMLLSLVLVMLTLSTIIGHSMLAPAVVIESTDAADAIQRVYAYVIGRFGRFALYLCLTIAMAVIADAAIHFVLVMAYGWTEFVSYAHALHSFWFPVVRVLLWGWLISYYSCSGSLLYLLMRRVNDEQDIREIWMPGMVPGTLAPIVEGEADEDDDA